MLLYFSLIGELSSYFQCTWVVSLTLFNKIDLLIKKSKNPDEWYHITTLFFMMRLVKYNSTTRLFRRCPSTYDAIWESSVPSDVFPELIQALTEPEQQFFFIIILVMSKLITGRKWSLNQVQKKLKGNVCNHFSVWSNVLDTISVNLLNKSYFV